jgi:peptide subunit release factor 1 (eRF1)
MSITSALPSVGDLPHVLRAVRQSASDRFLSVYLDTRLASAADHGYLIAFRDGCKAMRSQLDPGDDDDRRRYEGAVQQVEDYLGSLPTPGTPGLAIFAAGTEGGVLATALPSPPADRVVWASRPLVEPLVAALDECERIAVLLFDKERARLFTLYLGQIEERQLLVDEVPGKQETGDWFALSQKRYERHHEDHVLRHAKRTIRALSDVLRTYPFDRLFIGGTDEAVSLLAHHLPRPLRDRYAGSLGLSLFAGDDEVRSAALAAAEITERREETEEVRALLDAKTEPHVALGLESTLGALAEGRVHRLYVAAGLDRDGAWCERCGRLTAQFARCPTCGGPAQATANLGEQAIEAALAQGASVEIVSGQAASLLMEQGGLGALTRY